MDAEQLQFPDSSFDLIWTWAVIHHSSNTRRILEEMRRVLRPGGKAIVMVYHRTFWEYYVQGAVLNVFSRSGLHASIQQRPLREDDSACGAVTCGDRRIQFPALEVEFKGAEADASWRRVLQDGQV